MYSYIAYGLHIYSELLLPELEAGQPSPPDVRIRLGHEVSLENAHNAFHVGKDRAVARWQGVGEFVVMDGTEIVVYPATGVNPEILRLPLLGSVLAVLLDLRGVLVLHANVVECGDGVIGLLGARGQGKSTLAAAMCARGHALVTDDVMAVDLDRSDGPVVLPGPARLKLWPDSVAAVFKMDPENLPRLHPFTDKRAVVFSKAGQGPLPLRSLNALSVGAQLQMHTLVGQDALVALLGNLYVPSLVGEEAAASGAGLRLQQCANLLARIPARRLERPQALDQLGRAAELLEWHASGGTEAGFRQMAYVGS